MTAQRTKSSSVASACSRITTGSAGRENACAANLRMSEPTCCFKCSDWRATGRTPLQTPSARQTPLRPAILSYSRPTHRTWRGCARVFCRSSAKRICAKCAAQGSRASPCRRAFDGPRRSLPRTSFQTNRRQPSLGGQPFIAEGVPTAPGTTARRTGMSFQMGLSAFHHRVQQ